MNKLDRNSTRILKILKDNKEFRNYHYNDLISLNLLSKLGYIYMYSRATDNEDIEIHNFFAITLLGRVYLSDNFYNDIHIWIPVVISWILSIISLVITLVINGIV